MSKFGDLSAEDMQRFNNEIHKNDGIEYKDSESQLWPEDDDELVKGYFNNGNKSRRV